MTGLAPATSAPLARPAGSQEPAVAVRDVFCVHRTGQGDAAALQGLTLSVAAGERVCVLGPSGAGKTTLLRVIAGLQRPSAGSVRVFGVDVSRLSGWAAARVRHTTIGVLHQQAQDALSPDLPIRDAVGLPLALRGASRGERRRRVGLLLAAAGLGEREDALPGSLSGGERQRAAVCAAVAHRPRLLLADEPTAELDETAAAALWALIDELTARDGTTVIAVSHDPALASGSERTVRIRDGRVVADGGTLVVAPGGWVRLGDERTRHAGIGERVHAEATGDGLLLRPAGEPPAPAVPVEPAVPDGHAVPGTPAVGDPGRSRGERGTPVGVATRSVTRRHDGREILSDLSIAFAAGELTAVVGRSGAGKTTLLELLAGLASPDGGEILLDGRPLAQDAEARAAIRRTRIGYLSQEPVPIGFLSATENVALALTARGESRERAAARAREALTRVGLADRLTQRVSRLSAGEAQRVALARALACAAGLLIVDEPTSRVDEETAAAIAELLAAAAERDGHTVICATHDPQVVTRADATVTLGGAPPRPRTAVELDDGLGPRTADGG